jgi:uncharacterized protein (TIGR02265 family)
VRDAFQEDISPRRREHMAMQLQRASELVRQRPELRGELNGLFERIQETPETNTVKGMYVNGIIQALHNKGVHYNPPERPQPFKDYPLRGYMELLLDSAVTLYPKTNVNDGLFRLGQLAIPTFAQSIVGKVFMGTAGRSWELSLKYVSRGYEVSLKPGKATVAEIGNGMALVQLRDVYNFGESYQVGVIDGLMSSCGIVGKITPHVISACDVDMRIEWQSERTGRSRSQRPASPRANP